MRKRVLMLTVFAVLAVCLMFPSVALAHGADQSFADEWTEHGLFSTALVVGGLVVFGGGAFLALRWRR